MNRIAVPSADFIRNIGRWQNEALRNPVVITHHGRERLVLASPEQFKGDAAANESGSLDAALLEMRASAEALLANMSEGRLALDPYGRIESVNTAASVFLGRAAEDFAGRPVREAFPDLLALVITDRAQRVWRTRNPERFEADAGDGRRLAFRTYPAPNGVVVLFHSVTEETNLRRACEDADAMEQALRRHTDASFVKLDSRGRLEQIDESFCNWLGFAADDLSGHRFADLLTGAVRRDSLALLERVMRDGGAERADFVLLGRQGGEIACEATIAPIMADYVARGAIVFLVRKP